MTNYETHTYPENPIILYKTTKHSFTYKILQEGIYPKPPILAYTQLPNKYKIPNGYIVQTSWGKKNSKIVIECSITYKQQKPVFQIKYEQEGQQYIEIGKSATGVANQYQKVN